MNKLTFFSGSCAFLLSTQTDTEISWMSRRSLRRRFKFLREQSHVEHTQLLADRVHIIISGKFVVVSLFRAFLFINNNTNLGFGFCGRETISDFFFFFFFQTCPILLSKHSIYPILFLLFLFFLPFQYLSLLKRSTDGTASQWIKGLARLL